MDAMLGFRSPEKRLLDVSLLFGTLKLFYRSLCPPPKFPSFSVCVCVCQQKCQSVNASVAMCNAQTWKTIFPAL